MEELDPPLKHCLNAAGGEIYGGAWPPTETLPRRRGEGGSWRSLAPHLKIASSEGRGKWRTLAPRQEHCLNAAGGEVHGGLWPPTETLSISRGERFMEEFSPC